jgi:hypothetical protein
MSSISSIKRNVSSRSPPFDTERMSTKAASDAWHPRRPSALPPPQALRRRPETGFVHGPRASFGCGSVLMEGHPKTTRAYAWSSPVEGSDKRRFYAVLHLGGIRSPLDAVRAAIVAEHKNAN